MPDFFDLHDEAAQVPGGLFGPEVGWLREGWTVIGVDEAGRGPLAGPVVTAAAAFSPDIIIDGIGDSKQLTAKRREELFPVICEKALAYSIVESSPKRIDEINILMATREAMAQAVKEVADKLKVDYPGVFVDGRIPPLAIGHQVNLIKGDGRSFSIGAASILAKVHRDKIMVEMDKKYPEYGFAQHKGYGTKLHVEAIRKHGRCAIHRVSFRLKQLGEK